ncbi:MAG TPA: GerMN domain-containing protein [Vicinamibacteria bacterium]|nr:GerMN domain-containing protein [Vicinamibacteria bacterium]
MTRRTANLATILGLLLLLAGATLSAPRWSRLFRQEVVAPVDETMGEAAAEPAAEEPGEARRSINVRLFFNSAAEPGLVMEERELAFSSDLSRQLRTVVEELVKGPKPGSELLPTLPAATRVLEVFVTARGVAYVDLSSEATQGHAGGVSEELRSVYSIVNSVTVNFPAIRRVQILVDDRPAETLAGHVDLSRPLPPDMTLLASSILTPVKPSPVS